MIGHDVDRLRLVGVHVDREAEVGRQVAADLVPRVAGVVAAHHVPVLLHEQHVGPRRVHGDAVDAVADLGVGSGMYSECRPRLIGFQVAAAVVGAERARGRDGDEDPVRDRSGRAGWCAGTCRPRRAASAAPSSWLAQPGQLLPGLAAVGRAEQGGVLDAGVDGVRVGQRRLEVPDALELPGVRRAVVPLVGAGHAVVGELVADRLPRLAAVVGALDHLPEPAAGLRRVEPVRDRPASP